MGQCDVQASWCAEQDLPSNLIEEYNQQMQPHTELLSVNYSGQAAVTAVVITGASSSAEPQAKKSRIGHLNSATEGYYTCVMCVLYVYIKIHTIIHLLCYI